MNELQTEFVPYDLSLKMKALGFDEPCIYYVDKNNNSYIYNFQTHPDEFIEWCGVNVIPTPTFSQCFRWFREKYTYAGFIQLVEPEYGGDYGYVIYYKLNHLAVDHWNKGFKSYEEAELACLDKLISIIESKQETR